LGRYDPGAVEFRATGCAASSTPPALRPASAASSTTPETLGFGFLPNKIEAIGAGIHLRYPPVTTLAAWLARLVAASSIASAAMARAAPAKPLPRLKAMPPGTITAAELMYCSDGGSTGSM
jgi:hypothetical protein